MSVAWQWRVPGCQRVRQLAMLLVFGAAAVAGETCDERLAQGNAQAALGEFRRAAVFYQAAFGAASGTFDAQLQAWYLLAYCHERLGECGIAAEHYERLTSAYAAAHGTSEWVRRAWLGLGNCRLRLGHWQEAQTAFLQAERSLDDDIGRQARFARASSFSRPENPQADLAQAAALFEQILQQDPRHAAAAYGLAECRRRTGDVEGALAAYRRVRETDPAGLWGAAAQTMLGTLHQQRGETTEARNQYAQVLSNALFANTVLGENARTNILALAGQLPGRTSVTSSAGTVRAAVSPVAEAVVLPTSTPRSSDRWELRATGLEQRGGVSIFAGPVRVTTHSAIITCATADLRANGSILSCNGDVRIEQDRQPVRLAVDHLVLRIPQQGVALRINKPE